MATFNEILQGYVNMSYDQLLSIAKPECRKFATALMTGFDGDSDTASKALLMFFAVLLGADGRLTKLEHQFLNDMLGGDHSYEDTCEMVAALSRAESRELIDNMIDAMPDEYKAAGLTVALCFCAVDESITREEVAFFAKLMD